MGVLVQRLRKKHPKASTAELKRLAQKRLPGLPQQSKPPQPIDSLAQKKLPKPPGDIFKPGGKPRFDIYDAKGQPRYQGVPARPVATPATASAGSKAVAAKAPPIDPRDSRYFSDTSRLKFDADTRRAEIEQSSAYDRTDFQEALRRMLEGRPKDVQAARESANEAGLLRSGHLGKQLGEIETSYTRRESDTRMEFDRREAAREAARRALQAGYSIDDAAAYAEAAERQVGRDADSAAAKTLAPPTAKPAVAKKTPKKKPKSKAKKKVDRFTPSGKRRKPKRKK